MTHCKGVWLGCVVVTLVACGTPDNGGVEISFGPSVPSATSVGSIGGDESSSEAGESSSTTDDPPDPTNDAPPPDPTDWEETTESSGVGDDGSSSDGGEAAVQCVGLDEATCMATLGCGWPTGDEIFGMGAGPCGWDPAACPTFDPQSCTLSPACVLLQGEQNMVCTGVTCDVLDQLACPTVAGCFWYADPESGGLCFGDGFG